MRAMESVVCCISGGSCSTTRPTIPAPTQTGNPLQPDVNMDQLRALMTDSNFNGIVASCGSIAAAWIRAFFHDAGTFDGTNGGADGSLQFELQDPENFGLEGTLGFFQSTKQWFPDVSMADIIDWGAISFIKACGGPELTFRAGRVDAVTRNTAGTLPGNPNTPMPLLVGWASRPAISLHSPLELTVLGKNSHAPLCLHMLIMMLSKEQVGC
ncbi:hypothetical protein HK102_003560 [Quaeritorhiza haematococci]|nr:hypothetical protein HK102_003560 [Quaeritorhiza haematococci]